MTFERTTPEAVRPRLSRYRVVDVRAPYELDGPLGHIAGSEAIPLAEVESRAAELCGAAPVLFVCRSGKRSATACEMLARHGAVGVANLEGGMIAWLRAGLPVERERPPSAAAILESLALWLAQVTGRSAAAGRAEVDAALRAAGGRSGATPTPQIVLAVLDALDARLRESGPPADHDLTFAAFRADARALRE